MIRYRKSDRISAECQAAMNKALQELLRQVDHDLRAQLIPVDRHPGQPSVTGNARRMEVVHQLSQVHAHDAQ